MVVGYLLKVHPFARACWISMALNPLDCPCLAMWDMAALLLVFALPHFWVVPSGTAGQKVIGLLVAVHSIELCWRYLLVCQNHCHRRGRTEH